MVGQLNGLSYLHLPDAHFGHVDQRPLRARIVQASYPALREAIGELGETVWWVMSRSDYIRGRYSLIRTDSWPTI